MASCKLCGHDVIEVTHGATALILDPHYYAYASVEEDHLWPVDGDRVFLTTGLVEHRAVCAKQRTEQERAQAAYRAKHSEQGVKR